MSITAIAHPILDGRPGEIGLNHQQKDAVLSSFTHDVMIIAGAGSGKTATATRRAAFLLTPKRGIPGLPPTLSPNGESPGSILMITFTKKAGAEMRERTAKLVGEDKARKVWIGTFHSVCIKLLRQYPAEAGMQSNKFTILDEDDAKPIIRECMVAAKLTGLDVNGVEVDPITGGTRVDPKAIDNIRGRISEWKNLLKTPGHAEMEMVGEEDRDAVRVYKRYQARLERDHQLDFDDVIMKTVQGLQRPDSEMARYCHERFRWIMVDEFQDSNEAQFQLISSIAGPFTNVVAVGKSLPTLNTEN